MNVAMVVYSHYSRDARVRRYAEALVRSNHRVDIICLSENYRPKEKNIRLFMFSLNRRRLGRLWYLVEYSLFSLYTLVYLSLLSLFRDYKFIHVHNMPDILVFTAIIPKILGNKIILDMHDPMPELYMSKYHVGKTSLMVKLLILLEQFCFRFSDYVITANEEFKKIFLSRKNNLDNKITVILNCPDQRIFINKGQRIKRKEQFILFYMGTVDRRFGLNIAIEAIPEIVKHIAKFKFMIVPKLENEGEYFKNLAFRIQNSELKKNIYLFKPIPLEKIASKMREVDVGVVLAQNGVFTDNIFPVKLLEFVQMGIPVIASKTKILDKYFDNRSICFLKQNTADEFANAIITLWRNKKLRRNLANSAKKYLKKYNWEKEEKKYLRLVHD